MTAYTAPTWADPVVVAAAARASMGMPADDPDAETVQDAAASAIELVDRYLGSGVFVAPDEVPPPVTEATVIVTVELYRRKDAVFGVLNGWGQSDFGPVRVSTDWLKGVESLLHPYMDDSFGVG